VLAAPAAGDAAQPKADSFTLTPPRVRAVRQVVQHRSPDPAALVLEMGATRLDRPDSGLGLLVQRAPIASRSLASAAGQRALVTPSGDVPFIPRGAIQWRCPGQARSSFAWVRG
jgi:hypothetical protein